MTRAQSEIEAIIRLRAAAQPDEIWLTFGEDRYAWRDVLSLSQRAANGLLGLGLGPGDRLGIMARNMPEFLWVYFGAMMIGIEIVPLNRGQRGPALEHMIADSGIVALAIDKDLQDVTAPLRQRHPALRHMITLDCVPRDNVSERTADTTFAELMAAPDREPEVALAEPVGAVGIIYTSGTTGPPKGIVAAQYEPLLHPVLRATGIQPGETIYTCLPLFHANALMLSVIGSIRLGAKLALDQRFSASQFLDSCRRYEAIETNVMGAMIPMLLKQPRRDEDRNNPLRTVLSVGCPETVWREFEERFDLRVVEFYGMSDAPGNVVNTAGKVGSIGKPIDGARYRIADEHDRTLPPGTLGQILFRHPAGRATRYHNLPEATDAAYSGGWFHSGDLGQMDEAGFFYFRGRMNEAIRRRGENISAWEIEVVVSLHPKVQEAAAFGVASELGDEEVMLAVVPRVGMHVLPEEILDFCRVRLAYYAVPRYVEFCKTLPKTGTQKIQHNVLKQRGVTPDTWDRERVGYVVQKTGASEGAGER